MGRTAVGVMALWIAACATPPKAQLTQLAQSGSGLYFGHGQKGEIVVSGSHYQAMSGRAVSAAELGQEGSDTYQCKREMPTGTHVPTWVCRSDAMLREQRTAVHDELIQPRVTPTRGN